MLALRVRYLTGRVYAAAFDEGDAKRTVEWPPHPSRLYSALVSAWGDGGAEPELIPVLEWLEKSPPAVYHAGQALIQREPVNVFVPVNDSRGEESLPEYRPRKGRTFPSAHLPSPEVWFVWDGTLPEENRPGLEELLRRTPALGHSASFVAVEIGDAVPDGFARFEPGGGPRAVRLRVPTPGRLQSLRESYARFAETGAKVHRPSRGATMLYREAAAAVVPAPRGIFREMVVLRRAGGERAGLAATLSLTSALRGALLKLGPQPSIDAISGHAPESTPECPVRGERPHVALIPLAFVGSPHATGELLGAAILLPETLTGQARNGTLEAIMRVAKLKMPFGEWTVELATEEARVNLLPEIWTQASRRWATVTPYVFDRYPADPYGEEAREIVCRSFERVGLPEPRSVTLTKTSGIAGVPVAGRFPPAQGRPGKPRRFHLHAEVTFDRPVAGPMVAGAGRFYGYGLFRPVRGGKA